MRIVLLVTDLQRGGTPLRVARLARGLRSSHVDVHVGCLAPPGPVGAELGAAGIPTFACGAKNAGDMRAVRRLTRHVRAIRPDLIHATLTHANVAARLVGLVTHVPVLTSTATIEVERPWHRYAEMLTAPLDRGHIVAGPTLADHVAQAFHVPRRRIHVVPPSIDELPAGIDRVAARKALEIPDHEFVVLWAGRFDPVKRIELIVRCAEILSTVPSRFLIAGDGPHRDAVERAVRLGSAARTVHLLGWRDDLPTLMLAADVFLFPSLTEGMPNAVLQAMAAGLSVVASDIPTLRELSGDAGRLMLVAGDEPKPFADALMSLREDEQARRALAGRAADWARNNLDPAATVRATLDVYRTIVRAGREKRRISCASRSHKRNRRPTSRKTAVAPCNGWSRPPRAGPR